MTWTEPPPRRLDDLGPHCRLCGGLLPGRVWSAVVDGEEHPFCDPECEEIYRTYWLPRHGAGTRTS